MVKTPGFHYREVGSIPAWGTKIPHALQHRQSFKNKTKQLCFCYLHLQVFSLSPSPPYHHHKCFQRLAPKTQPGVFMGLKDAPSTKRDGAYISSCVASQ